MFYVFLALITAFSWGVGGFFEKKGLHIGGLSPQMGITLRTGVAFIILSVVSFSEWKTLGRVDTKALAYMFLGGGLLAGTIGMLSFYGAIRGAPLNRVMPVAFTAPLFGAFMGAFFGGESLSLKGCIGIALTVSGIVVLTLSK